MECRRCKKDLDEDNFPSNGVGGLRHQCKECMREINQRWRRLNQGKVAEYNKNRMRKIIKKLESEVIETETLKHTDED